MIEKKTWAFKVEGSSKVTYFLSLFFLNLKIHIFQKNLFFLSMDNIYQKLRMLRASFLSHLSIQSIFAPNQQLVQAPASIMH